MDEDYENIVNEGVIEDVINENDALDEDEEYDVAVEPKEEEETNIVDYTTVLSNVAKRKDHVTTPFLTRFEKTRVIGARIQELNKGAPAFVDTTGLTSTKDIALKELKAGRIPYIIQRPLPDGTNDEWKLADLMIVE